MSEKQPEKSTHSNRNIPNLSSENSKPLKKRFLNQDDLSVSTHREFMGRLEKAKKEEQSEVEQIDKKSSG